MFLKYIIKLFLNNFRENVNNSTTTGAAVLLFSFTTSLIWGKYMKKNPWFTVGNFLVEKNSTYVEFKGQKNIKLKNTSVYKW